MLISVIRQSPARQKKKICVLSDREVIGLGLSDQSALLNIRPLFLPSHSKLVF